MNHPTPSNRNCATVSGDRCQDRCAGTKRTCRRGFTLVELLTVIAIIGVLAALAIPAITGALRAAREGAVRLEVENLGQALEAYKTQYGAYPPDFYDWNQVERHFLKAFPNIDDNEFRILAQFTHYGNNFALCNVVDPRVQGNFNHYPHAIDRAEALVFCLGGFSDDQSRPFTGQGGPLVPVTGASLGVPAADDYLRLQYNTERQPGFFDFGTENLSIVLHNASGPLAATQNYSGAYTYSGDEDFEQTGDATFFGNDLMLRYYPDPFPTYQPSNSDQPVAYFSAPNYQYAWGKRAGRGSRPAWGTNLGLGYLAHTQNLYMPAGEEGSIADNGVARPYASNVVDTTPPSSVGGRPPNFAVLQFAEPNRFQLVSAGIDGNYGGVVGTATDADATGISVFPLGSYYNPFVSLADVNKYQDDLFMEQSQGEKVYGASPQLDNITNFSSRTLESDLP